MSTNQSVFSRLSEIPFADKVERKGSIDYLSWAFAWSLLKGAFPGAQRIVYEDPSTGWNYFTDGRTAWVKVGVIVEEQEHIDYLPIMDHRNNAIAIEKITQFDVNKAIQRSTAKAIAMHGLGLQLWTGEDIPELTTTQSAPLPAARKGAKTTSVATPDESNLIVLEKDSENWVKVVNYVTTNRSLGMEKIGKQLNRKYKISATLKKEIANLINQQNQSDNEQQQGQSGTQQ